MADVGDTAGIGGHLYSLQALVAAMIPRAECRVVALGSARCPAFETLDCPRHQIPFGKDRLRLRELAQVMDIVRRHRPDVIHAFDVNSCAFARRAARRAGCGLVMTRCGGPNPEGRFPRMYFPRVRRLVVFSEENRVFFQTDRRFRRARIWHIPNRIGTVAVAQDRIDALRRQLRPGVPVILRIGRISPGYEKTAGQSIRLVKRLAAEGIPVQLVFVGVVQDARTDQAIRAALAGHGEIVSDPEITGQASAILDLGDLVVGTGRGLMEATARGRIALVPTRAGDLPALLTPDNWESLFRFNFSERSEIQAWDEEQNYAAIRRALTDPAYRQELAAFGRAVFAKHFAMSGALARYLAVYEESRAPEAWQFVDPVRHWLWMMIRTRNRAAPAVAAGNSGGGGQRREGSP